MSKTLRNWLIAIGVIVGGVSLGNPAVIASGVQLASKAVMELSNEEPKGESQK